MTAFDTVCPQRPNGNTPLAPEQQVPTPANWTRLPGTTATPKMKPTLSDRRSRMHGVCTTWKVTSRNGSRTTTRPLTTPTVPPLTPLVRRVGAVAVVAGVEDLRRTD